MSITWYLQNGGDALQLRRQPYLLSYLSGHVKLTHPLLLRCSE